MISDAVDLIRRVINIEIDDLTKYDKLTIRLPRVGSVNVDLSYITGFPESELVIYESIYQHILELFQSHCDAYAEIYTDTFEQYGHTVADDINHYMLPGTGLILFYSYNPSKLTHLYRLRFNDGWYTQYKVYTSDPFALVKVKKNINAVATYILDMLQFRFEKVARDYADSKF